MANCLNCNTELNKGRKYCNNRCQADHRTLLANIEVENGRATTIRQVRNYLITKHGSICLSPDCAWDFTKQKLVVELEHIDGNSDNHKLENCTLLCPNCHSLTPTYKNRNMGNGRHVRRQRYAEGKSH